VCSIPSSCVFSWLCTLTHGKRTPPPLNPASKSSASRSVRAVYLGGAHWRQDDVGNLADGLGALEGSRWRRRASGGRPVAGARVWMVSRGFSLPSPIAHTPPFSVAAGLLSHRDLQASSPPIPQRPDAVPALTVVPRAAAVHTAYCTLERRGRRGREGAAREKRPLCVARGLQGSRKL
jgi:hypothetical protein